MGNKIVADTNLFRRKIYDFNIILDQNIYYMTYFSYFELMDGLVRNTFTDEEKTYVNYIFNLVEKNRIILLLPRGVAKTNSKKYYVNFEISPRDKRDSLLGVVAFTISQFISTILLYVVIGVANSIAESPNSKQYKYFSSQIYTKEKYDFYFSEVKEILTNGYRNNTSIRKNIENFFHVELENVINIFVDLKENSMFKCNDYLKDIKKIYKKDSLSTTDEINNEFIYFYCFAYAKSILEEGKQFKYNDVIDMLNIYYAHERNYKYITNDVKSIKMIKRYLCKVEGCKYFFKNNIEYIK